MFITPFIDPQKSNYSMTDAELRQWQEDAKAWCEYDNYLNRMLECSNPPASEFLEESAINMAIESHGITTNRSNNAALPSVSTVELASIDDDYSSFDQRAISAAIEFQGLGIPPPIQTQNISE